MHHILELLSQKKVVLWDFDGCFCDSEPVHFLAYSKAFKKYGHTVDMEEYYETFTHTGGGVAKEVENHNVVCDADDVRLKKADYYWESISQGEAKVFPQIPQIISHLNRMNIKSVIASNSLPAEIKLVLSTQSEPIEIDNIFGFEVGLRKKPHPDIFLHALSALGISPQDALVMEDSERGLFAAQAAQCDALWVNTYLTQKFSTTAPYVAKISHAELLHLLSSK